MKWLIDYVLLYLPGILYLQFAKVLQKMVCFSHFRISRKMHKIPIVELFMHDCVQHTSHFASTYTTYKIIWIIQLGTSAINDDFIDFIMVQIFAKHDFDGNQRGPFLTMVWKAEIRQFFVYSHLIGCIIQSCDFAANHFNHY